MSDPQLQLDPRTTALVLIDLENGTTSFDLAPYSATQVVQACNRVIAAFRAAGAPVVFVHVDLDDEPDVPADRAKPAGATPPPASASELVADLDVQPGDEVLVKKQYGAFWETGLHELLRSRGVDTIVLGGIDTNFGVESTGREAFDRRYAVVYVEDAMSSIAADMQQFSVEKIVPVLGRVRTVDQVVAALPAAPPVPGATTPAS